MADPRETGESDDPSRDPVRSGSRDGDRNANGDGDGDEGSTPPHRRTDGRSTTDGDRSPSPEGTETVTDADSATDGTGLESADETTAELLRQVEEKYDFDDFGPRDMVEMTAEEWDVAFDADTWITGDELLERVEKELKSRIADRDVFAILEYAEVDGQRSLVAYSDTDYAIIYPDGSVEGRGTVVRDVKPSVALCSMDSYDVEDPPADWRLPSPEAVPESTSELGNWMLQLLAATQLLVGLGALVAWPILGARDNIVLLAAGLGFTFIGIVLFAMVANARLSEKFRLEEYRTRLRSIGAASDDRPEFLPIDDEDFEPVGEVELDPDRTSFGDGSTSADDGHPTR